MVVRGIQISQSFNEQFEKKSLCYLQCTKLNKVDYKHSKIYFIVIKGPDKIQWKICEILSETIISIKPVKLKDLENF